MYGEIAARAFNVPLLVHPAKAAAFVRGLGPRILGSSVEPVAFGPGGDPPPAAPPKATLLGDDLVRAIRADGVRAYPVVDGVAIVAVSGVLIHRGAWIGQSSGQTSYEGLRAQIDAAAADPEVRAIALEIDSFGGEVAGCFDLADRIRAVRESKPVRAFVAEHAYSAAYALASQADRVVVARTGGVGSIGVVCMHMDTSRALDRAGVTVTLIHAGQHKVDGNPYEPLPEGVAADLQRQMETLRQLFAATVALGRKARGLDARAALATEARCFEAGAAVAAGLADSVEDPRAAFGAWLKDLRRGAAARNGGGPVMADGASVFASARDRMSRRAEDDEDEDRAAEDDGLVGAAEDDEDEDRAAEHDEMAGAAEGGEDEDRAAEDDEVVGAAEGGEDEDRAAEDDEDEDRAAEGEDGQAKKTATARERRRIAAILEHPAAEGRKRLARHLAFRTTLPAASAVEILEAAPRPAAGRLDLAMRDAGATPLGPAAPDGAAKLSLAALMRQRFAK